MVMEPNIIAYFSAPLSTLPKSRMIQQIMWMGINNIPNLISFGNSSPNIVPAIIAIKNNFTLEGCILNLFESYQTYLILNYILKYYK